MARSHLFEGINNLLIDRLEEFYRSRATSTRINPFRASAAGYCERRLGYDKLGIEGEPITPRRAAVFRHGHIIDMALKQDLAEVLGDSFVNLDKLPYNKCEIEGVTISFMPDGAFQTNSGEIGIVELKTMADYSFDRALKGEIDRAYLCQAWVYHYGTSFNPVVFVAYRKETSHFCEIIFDCRQQEKVITQRFGGDPQALWTNDPLLVADIRTPFDDSVEEEVRGKFRRLAQVTQESELAEGVRAIEAETVSVQGKEKAGAVIAEHPEWPIGTAKISGSWYKFETGRKIAKFPCSYCPHIKRCLGATLEFKNDKPIWVVGGKK